MRDIELRSIRISAFKNVHADLESGVDLEDMEHDGRDVCSNVWDDDPGLDQFAEDHGLGPTEEQRWAALRYYGYWYARLVCEIERGATR